MAVHGRAGGGEHAERVNAAAELAERGVPAAEAARLLAGGVGCSPRQAPRGVGPGAPGRGPGPGGPGGVTAQVPGRLEWGVEEEGNWGGRVVGAGLEGLRDLAAQGCLDVVLVYSPDRLARKFAYQALLLEEFARAGVRVEFVKGPRSDTPEDQLLVQFQGIFAEYEKAQLTERYRRGKAYRAPTGSVNVLSGAPFGYRYVRKTDLAGAAYEVIAHEAALVAEMFRRYADDGASIADLARWLTGLGAPTRTGKNRWDRSVVWAMLRNPAYAGTAVFGKTMATSGTPALHRAARQQGRSTPRAVKTVARPREAWLEIPVPAIVSQDAFARVRHRLEANQLVAPLSHYAPS